MKSDRYFVRDGASIRYRDEGSGPPVILVHGWTLDLEMWNPQSASLSSRYRVLRLDRRGFGLSSGHPSIESDVQDLSALCGLLSLERIALVGMSQGARSVMSMAAATPGKISCVMLDGPPDLLGTDVEDSESLGRYRELTQTNDIDAFRREWIHNPLMRLTTRDPAAHCALQSMVNRYPGIDLANRAVIGDSTLQALDLANFQIPTLIVTGEQDMADRVESANNLARIMPQAERATIPDAGHLPNLDNPSPYNATLQAFLERHAIAPG